MLSRDPSKVDVNELFMTSSIGDIYIKAIERIEREVIEKALEFSLGNKILAAKMLGINRNTIHTKIKKLKIDVERFKR